MSIYKEILQKYWGYPDFRPLQEDIIKSVADEGKDTLGLLPTGGGKSIIFQVPALAKEGLCIVVSPLIALMKDQVENLKRRKIQAAAVYTGMSRNEVELTFEKALNQEIKFLYLSPERLGTKLFLNYLEHLKVNLIAVDEAHCISQWGYDFRPSYLKIADIRPYLPGVPVLALTATATPKVVDDIQEKLKFREKNVFRKSFARKNLVYLVRKNDDKLGQLLKLAKGMQGTGVVYVRSRKLTEKIADFLRKNNISADYYHAGLSPSEKDKKQDLWKNDHTRIMVATNAFGMGIDKPDVRFVIHIDLPDSLEAYFQEAGRGGRDLKDAYAFLIYNDNDILKLRQNFEKSFPPKEKIKNVYEALCNYFKIPVGTGKNQNFEFVITKFAEHYNFNLLDVYNSLKFLQKEQLIEYTEEITEKSKIHIILNKEDLYKFQVANPKYDSFIKFLLRNLGGLFSSYVPVDEYRLAKSAHTEPKVIFSYLNALYKKGVIDYVPRKNTPYITLTKDRIHPSEFDISDENYRLLKDSYKEKIDAVIHYVQTKQCRSQLLLAYFGETDSPECGRCDVCYVENQIKTLEKDILQFIKTDSPTIDQVTAKFINKKSLASEILRNLIDNKKIIFGAGKKLLLNEKKQKPK